jgi:hypothetical protein
VVERDWVQVVAEERCDECGLAPSHLARADLGPALRHEAEAWAALLAGTGDDHLRARSGESWSALEYAAHTRDTLAVFAGRIERVRLEDDPQLGWWDHEAAAVDERYNEQDPGVVAAALVGNARALADLLAAIGGEEWGRTATRRAGERFTIEGMGRFALHEARHHRADAERASRSS